MEFQWLQCPYNLPPGNKRWRVLWRTSTGGKKSRLLVSREEAEMVAKEVLEKGLEIVSTSIVYAGSW